MNKAIYTSLSKIFFSILFSVVFTAFIAEAQFYSIGTDPAKAKWRYIQAGDFRVIYPQELDSLARRYAFLFNASKEHVLAPLKVDIRPIDVILHPYTVNSNGVVTWAPRRVELMTRPWAEGGYAQNWEKQLVAHELRHVGQVSKFEGGIFKPLRFLIGEQATGLGLGLLMASWTLEGDAVVSETELSSSGRGRDADHLMYYKAAFLNGDSRDWQRWKLGSLKYYSPNEYSLGYMLGSYVKYYTEKYDYLGDVTDYSIAKFYNPMGETNGYKKYTGLNLPENFEKSREAMSDMWAREDAARAPFSPATVLNSEKRDYISYTSPMIHRSGRVFAVKSDMNSIRRLISVDSVGREKVVYYFGYMTSPPVITEDEIYWTESVSSARWELQSFSEIFVYDIERGKAERLTRKGSYYHPFVTSEEIMVVSYPVTGSSEILFLDRESLSVKERIAAPKGWQFKEGVMYNGKIYATAITEKGVGLYSCERGSSAFGGWVAEIEDQSRRIESLRVIKEGICFTSDLNGVSNLYVYEPETEKTRQMTNARFGVGGASLFPDGKRILYPNFSHLGYDMVSSGSDSLLRKEVSMTEPYRYEIADKLSEMADFSIDTVKIDKEIISGYESKRYSKVGNLLRLHSWAPIFYDVDKIKSMSFENVREVVKLGAIVYSQNSLNSANMMAGYSYDNGFHAGHLKFTYKGLYPVIEVNASVNTRNRVRHYIDRTGPDPRAMLEILSGSPYIEGYIRSYVPVNLSRGSGWSEGFVPSLMWRYTNDAHYSERKTRDTYYQYMTAAARYYRILGRGVREIFPRYGFGISAQITTAPFSEENFGSLFYTNAYGYIPGFIKNHGIRIDAAYQHQFYNGKRYLYSNNIPTPLGYTQRVSREALYLSAEYAMPLYTEDISLGALLYIERLQLIPFAQYMHNYGQNSLRENLLSVGSDFVLDFHVFGLTTQLSGGIRGAITMDGTPYFGLLFSTEFF